MKKTITIIAFNRPQYFKIMLESLVKNNLNGWEIFIGLDPSEKAMEQLKLIQEYIPQATVFERKWHIQRRSTPAEGRRNIARNSHDIISKAFLTGSKYNIYLEEDIILSPDITELADWYYELGDDSACLCFNNIGLCYQDLKNPDAAIIYPNKECTYSGDGFGFSPLGVVMKRDQFFTHMSPFWWHKNGWDRGIVYHMKDTKQKVLIPYQTRSDHIGVHGVNVRGLKHQKRLMLGNLDVCKNPKKKEDFWLSKEFVPCDFDPREVYK